MARSDRQGPSLASWMNLLRGARYWDGIVEQSEVVDCGSSAQVGGLWDMSDDRTGIMVPRNAYAAMTDVMQRAVVDRGASKATRKAAFAALLALVDAGLIRDTSSAPSAGDGIAPAATHARTGLRLTG
jgi:hypothetical protein